MEIMAAHKQWARRPDDERFPSLEALHGYCVKKSQRARTASVENLGTLRVIEKDGDVLLNGRSKAARFTNWSFGQLCSKIGAPAHYLQRLPAELVERNINHGLEKGEFPYASRLLLDMEDEETPTLRALTSERYSRIWDCDITERLLGLQSQGWEPARPTNDKEKKTPPSLYAGDRDMFAFLIHPDRRIKDGTDEGLARGFIIGNSEVGSKTFWTMRFFYRYICQNHIIWDASEVMSLSLRHVGTANYRAFAEMQGVLKQFSDESASEDEAKILRAQHFKLGNNPEEVLNNLFGRKLPGLSKSRITQIQAEAQPDTDGDPRTAWGMVNAITRFSQTLPYGDTRTELDKSAGRILTAV